MALIIPSSLAEVDNFGVEEVFNYNSSVNSIAWSPNSKKIAIGSTKGAIILQDVENKETVQVLQSKGNSVESVTWSPDGTRLATAQVDGKVLVWTIETGNAIHLMGHRGRVSSIAWSGDGSKIITAGSTGSPDYKGEIRIWNAKTGSELMVLEKHDSDIYTVAWSPDTMKFLSGSGLVWTSLPESELFD